MSVPAAIADPLLLYVKRERVLSCVKLTQNSQLSTHHYFQVDTLHEERAPSLTLPHK